MCSLIPQFVEVFLQVIIDYGSEEVCKELIVSMFQRVEQVRKFAEYYNQVSSPQLYPFKLFEDQIRAVIYKKIIEFFYQYPALLLFQKV